MCKRFSFYAFLCKLVSFLFLIVAIALSVKWYFIIVLSCVFPVTSDITFLSRAYWQLYGFGEIPIQILSHFKSQVYFLVNYWSYYTF
jgi:hypothetical protein